MKQDFAVEQAVKNRASVRTYAPAPLTKQEEQLLKEYMSQIENPFGADVQFALLRTDSADKAEKPGTYGVIKGATAYLGAFAAKGPLAAEGLGYAFEQLLLFATSLGLGTCWLGGTFQHSRFAEAMQVPQDAYFPAISPVGRPSGKRRVFENLSRWTINADHRKSWDALFFNQDFSTPLTPQAAGDFADLLELLRLAPSAMNRQPWRVLKDHETYHFFKTQAKKEDEAPDLFGVDLGIGACHFALGAAEKGLPGHFERLTTPGIAAPNMLSYEFSWVAQEPQA